MDIVARNGDQRKEGFARHAKIAVAMVVRHEPFVAPEPVRTIPWKARRNLWRREMLIEPPRRGAARQAHGEGAVARLRKTAQPFGDIARERFSALENTSLGRCDAGHCATTFACNVLFRIRSMAAA